MTGHGFGGGLATLFALQAATEPDSVMPKPVSLFSVASPYVGDESFRTAHLQLESLGKLRHLRLVNHKDAVTLEPKMSFRWNVFDSEASVGTLFKHAGMNMRLFDQSTTMEVSFPSVHAGYIDAAMDEVSRGWDQSIFTNFCWNISDYWKFPQHSLREYCKRMDTNKQALQKLYLNDLYGRHDVVGQLVPHC